MGGTNGVRVIPRCEVGPCQECSSRSVLLLDSDETEATLMLLPDWVPSQVSAEQCPSNVSRATYKCRALRLIECVAVFNKCFKLVCAGTAPALTFCMGKHRSVMRKEHLKNPVFRVLKRQKSNLQNERGACCNDPTVSPDLRPHSQHSRQPRFRFPQVVAFS